MIYYSLERYKEAWEDIEKAVDKSDDHVIKHFYLRALIYAGLGKYKESLGDFSNTVSLMKDLREKETTLPQDEDVQPEKEIP
jgi:tetratricopeptide (TPR) repeat protein